MAIDEIERRLADFLNYIPYDTEEGKKDCEAIETVIDIIKDYQTIKFNYERRLNADLRAILVDLQLQIEELKIPYYCDHYKFGLNDCSELIQQKIDALEAESEKDFTDECKELDGDCTRCTHKHHCISSEYNGRH